MPTENSAHPSIEDILARISAWFGPRGYQLPPPCSKEHLAKLERELRSGLGLELPPAYADFLERVNGLDFNGVLFFSAYKQPYAHDPSRSIEPLVPANLERRKRVKGERLLFLGESGMETYVFDPGSGAYQILDTVALDQYESHDTFAELIGALYRDRLP